MSAPKIPSSTAPAVRQYLFDQITTAVAAQNYVDPTVSVYLGNFSEPEDTSDLVIVGKKITRQIDANRIVGSGGQHWLREQYDVSISIMCASINGMDFTDCDARAFELLALVENVVRLDPSLGQRVIVAKPGTNDVDSEYDDDHSGAQTMVETVVGVLAEM